MQGMIEESLRGLIIRDHEFFMNEESTVMEDGRQLQIPRGASRKHMRSAP
jgi:hypothetical protein